MTSASQTPAQRVTELLERIAAAAGVNASVEVRQETDGLHAEYVGDDLGLLIGHHGQTIDAIQHLAYRFASHRDRERVAVIVDAAGYRERRATTLRATADQAAQTAISGRRAVPLEAMSALERKVIHEHLKDRHDVETYSEGQEPSRHLVVAPLVD
ncbi:MAG TPA: R3H domain-containing nucleic acid-binding protein [Solirubrobacteraceae bacterium]|jgi:spoIIIJ-associated protein|nr:R3H domain-containing nucleic acid-binding protein [Solirubrobacteraceae bacterium]